MKRVAAKVPAVAAMMPWLALAASSFAATCPPDTFAAPDAYPVAPYTADVISADFTGDGIPDIATLSVYYYGSSVSVLIGNPDGTFQQAVVTNLPDSAYAFTSGDFKTGGSLDLALSVGISGTNDYAIEVLPGNGDGTFQTPITSSAPYSFAHIAAAAFVTGDPLGLAGAGGRNEVVVFQGNGDGTFTAGSAVPTSIRSEDLVTGDLDGDGIPDILTSDGGSSIAALLGNGDGTFGPPKVSIAGKSITSPTVADFDGDGDLDVAVTSQNYVAVLLGNGDGTFQAPRDYPVGLYAGAVAAGDLNGDGHVDLVVNAASGSYAGAIRVLLGAGDGTFVEGSGYTVGRSIQGLIVDDFGGDGTMDIAAPDSDPSVVWVLSGNGDGTLQAVRADALGPRLSSLVSADFDGDGWTDLAAAFYQQSGIGILLQHPGGFVPAASITTPNAVVSIGAGDFDGDGIVDLAAATAYGDNFLLLLGNGDGTFQDPVPVPVNSYYISSLLVQDFNEDGNLDVGLAASGGSFSQPAFVVFRGAGDGSFGSPIASPLEYLPAAGAAGLLNADGHLDVALTNGTYYSGTDTVSVLLGNGDGTFGAPAEYATGGGPVSVAIADLDGDGARDLAVADADGTITVLLGAGDGTFADGFLVGVGARPTAIEAADFDGDGHEDLVTANSQDDSATLLRGLGGGAFDSPVSYPVGHTPLSVAVVDVLANGTPDAAIANSDGLGGLSILLNLRLSVGALHDGGGCTGGVATIHANAGGFGKLSYQWRKDGSPISDGGPVSGATTATLRIDPSSPSDEGTYDVVVTDACTTVTSQPASMIIQDPPAIPVIVTAASAPPDVPTDASVTNVPGHGYIWTVTNGTIVSGQGTSHIQFRAPLPGPVTLEVVESSAPGCSASSGALVVPVDFSDVPPSHPFHADIVTLAVAGVTAGCGPGLYCPSDPVTRAQMAVFLLKAKYGSSHQPNQFGPVFNDVPNGAFACYWINELWSYSITSGCGNNDYCPDASVTRAQMAVFIERTLGNYYPPPASGIFGDVPPGSFAADFIEALYTDGITGGCSASPLFYCPGALVTRGQMAAFLVRAFLGP